MGGTKHDMQEDPRPFDGYDCNDDKTDNDDNDVNDNDDVLKKFTAMLKITMMGRGG